MEAKIYQFTDKSFDKVDYVFQGWDKAKESFSINDYECVYTKDFGDVSWCTNWQVLDDIFYIFNMKRPEDFKGHSLSVSDVVSLDGELYYCDNIGWSKI